MQTCKTINALDWSQPYHFTCTKHEDLQGFEQVDYPVRSVNELEQVIETCLLNAVAEPKNVSTIMRCSIYTHPTDNDSSLNVIINSYGCIGKLQPLLEETQNG